MANSLKKKDRNMIITPYFTSALLFVSGINLISFGTFAHVRSSRVKAMMLTASIFVSALINV